MGRAFAPSTVGTAKSERRADGHRYASPTEPVDEDGGSFVLLLPASCMAGLLSSVILYPPWYSDNERISKEDRYDAPDSGSKEAAQSRQPNPRSARRRPARPRRRRRL